MDIFYGKLKRLRINIFILIFSKNIYKSNSSSILLYLMTNLLFVNILYIRTKALDKTSLKTRISSLYRPIKPIKQKYMRLYTKAISARVRYSRRPAGLTAIMATAARTLLGVRAGIWLNRRGSTARTLLSQSSWRIINSP